MLEVVNITAEFWFAGSRSYVLKASRKGAAVWRDGGEILSFDLRAWTGSSVQNGRLVARVEDFLTAIGFGWSFPAGGTLTGENPSREASDE